MEVWHQQQNQPTETPPSRVMRWRVSSRTGDQARWLSLNKWLKDQATRNAVLDAIVLEQFLTTMPPDLQVLLGKRKLKTVAEVAGLANNYGKHTVYGEQTASVEPEKGQQNEQYLDSCGQPFGSQGRPNNQFADKQCFSCAEHLHNVWNYILQIIYLLWFFSVLTRSSFCHVKYTIWLKYNSMACSAIWN